MDIKEAELYFKKYDGHGFHMFREEPVQYKKYKELNIGSDIEEQWRQDIIETLFQHFFDETQKVWLQHSKAVEIIKGVKSNMENNCFRLLMLMEQISSLDIKQKILILETMAGRTEKQEDGGCYLICSYTTMQEKMNTIMQDLIENALNAEDRDNTDERLFRAIHNYELAYARFKR